MQVSGNLAGDDLRLKYGLNSFNSNVVNLQEVNEVKNSENKTYSIDDILDVVEQGDTSILVKLGITYTDIKTETGDKKISFKYQGARYTINIVEPKDDIEWTNEASEEIINHDDGSYDIKFYDYNGNLIKTQEYDKDGNLISGSVVSGEEINEPEIISEDKETEIAKKLLEDLFNSNIDSKDLLSGFKTRLDDIMESSIILAENKALMTTFEYERMLQQNKNRLELFEKNINTVLEIQKLIENAKNTENSDALVSKLNGILMELCANEKMQNGVLEKNNILEKLSLNLEIPIPPSALDYTDSDGNFDNEKYFKLINEYQNKKEEYDNKISDFNDEILSNNNIFNEATVKIDSSLFLALGYVVENKINNLKTNGKTTEANELGYKLNGYINSYLIYFKIKNDTLRALNFINADFNSIKLGNPPLTLDFIDESGVFDEEKYNEALKNYESQKEVYNNTIESLQNKTEQMLSTIAELDNNMLNIQNDINSLI